MLSEAGAGTPCALGATADVAPILRETDLLLMTSVAESFCVAAAEAMACGIPVVATRVGGLAEVVGDGTAGHLFRLALTQPSPTRSSSCCRVHGSVAEPASPPGDRPPASPASGSCRSTRGCTGTWSTALRGTAARLTPSPRLAHERAAELAASEPGIFREEGVFLERRPFLKAISPPERGALARLSHPSGGGDGRPLVYVGQQLSVDYGASVLAKLTTLAKLQADDDVRGCALWVDVDRAGSDKRMTVISWPRRGGRAGVSIAPPGSKDREPRFIPIEKRSS